MTSKTAQQRHYLEFCRNAGKVKLCPHIIWHIQHPNLVVDASLISMLKPALLERPSSLSDVVLEDVLLVDSLGDILPLVWNYIRMHSCMNLRKLLKASCQAWWFYTSQKQGLLLWRIPRKHYVTDHHVLDRTQPQQTWCVCLHWCAPLQWMSLKQKNSDNHLDNLNNQPKLVTHRHLLCKGHLVVRLEHEGESIWLLCTNQALYGQTSRSLFKSSAGDHCLCTITTEAVPPGYQAPL